MCTESLVYDMLLYDLAGFVDQEGGGDRLTGGSAEPPPWLGAASAFCGL